MTRSTRLVLADLLVAALVVDFLVYLARGHAVLVDDARSMAGFGLVLALVAAACVVPVLTDRAVRPALAAGSAALLLGLAGLVWGDGHAGLVLVAAFVVAVVVTWLFVALRMRRPRPHPGGRVGSTG